jgi:hypothetical protein
MGNHLLSSLPMMYKLLNFLRKIVKNDIGASEKSIQELQKQIAFELSQDYIQLMKNFNAGEGEIG